MTVKGYDMDSQLRNRVIELFNLISLFAHFSPAEIREKFFHKGLAKIVEYQPAENIISEGKYDNWVYWLINGQIDVIKNTCRVATFERKGDMFGEMGILEGNARSACVYAVTQSICLGIDMSILDHPDLERKISRGAFCKDVAYVAKNRLAKTTSRLSETEHGLVQTKNALTQSEKELFEARLTIKKTLEVLEEKDKEVAGLKDQLEKLKPKE
jgi:CRP/FNR family transcriptional regulator, cyclic AMP receptor protein